MAASAALLFMMVQRCAPRAQPCRTVEVDFKPVKNLQIAVWVEDPHGNYVATAYVTRLTGSFGLANRPGNHFLHDRRPLSLRTPRHGAAGLGAQAQQDLRPRHHGRRRRQLARRPARRTASPTARRRATTTPSRFHVGVSSTEPFYCSPSGGIDHAERARRRRRHLRLGLLSAPRAPTPTRRRRLVLSAARRPDHVLQRHDGPDAHAFASVNDLTAVSGATPQLSS